MEAKHPLDTLLRTVRSAVGVVADSLEQHALPPLGAQAEVLLNRLQLVPKAEFDRLRADLEKMSQEVARLEIRLQQLGEQR